MKYMRAIDMLVALRFLIIPGKNITADMVPFFDDPALVPRLAEFMRADRAVKSGSHNQYAQFVFPSPKRPFSKARPSSTPGALNGAIFPKPDTVPDDSPLCINAVFTLSI